MDSGNKMSGAQRRVLIIVENLPCPFDRRVWQEAGALRDAGYQVCIICPKGKGYEEKYELLEGIHVYRHSLPLEAEGPLGYALEYAWALGSEFYLSCKIAITRGFDVIHACNPPDMIFLIGGFFKLFGKKFLFDHHDINPELYEAKFGKKDFFYNLMVWFERMTFKTASVSIATNQSYKDIAINRGGMPADRVHVVRSGPKLDRLKILPPTPRLKCGRSYLVGYVGVMGKQEGIEYLLKAAEFIVKELGREDVHFGLVGGGTELEALKQYARSIGVSDYVTFTGRASDEDLLAMLNTADVCVNPDEANPMNDKSTMNKIMEYMALAKPIVQFDLTEGRVSAEKASLYAKVNDSVDMAHKIMELLGDPDKRQQMGQYGRQRVEEQLQWEYEVPRLLEAYNQVFETEKT